MTDPTGNQCHAPIDDGPVRARCPDRGRLESPCPHCGAVFFACGPVHAAAAETVAQGHLLRAHFRQLPLPPLREIARDPARMAQIRALARDDVSGMFDPLIGFLEGLK